MVAFCSVYKPTNATIAQQAAVAGRRRSLHREDLDKSQKNLTDPERSGKLKENNLKNDHELQQLKESQEDIKWRHKNAVRELSDVKAKQNPSRPS